MITLQWIYWLAGGYVLCVAALGLRDRGNPRRITTALFWGLLGAMFLAADRLPAAAVGVPSSSGPASADWGAGVMRKRAKPKNAPRPRAWATACSGRRC